MIVVFHPTNYDPRPMFKDMEADETIRYVPVDLAGRVMEPVTIKVADTMYIVGKQVLAKPFTIIKGGDKL